MKMIIDNSMDFNSRLIKYSANTDNSWTKRGKNQSLSCILMVNGPCLIHPFERVTAHAVLNSHLLHVLKYILRLSPLYVNSFLIDSEPFITVNQFVARPSTWI